MIVKTNGSKARRGWMLAQVAVSALICASVAGTAMAESIPTPRSNPNRLADNGDITSGITPIAKPQRPSQASVASPANDIINSLSPSQLGLDAAIKLVDSGQVGKAAAIGRMMPDKTNRHIIEWLVAQSGSPDVSVAQITQVAQELPDWPGQALLRRRAEQALVRMNADPATIIAAFGKTQPGSDEGLILLTRAYVASGQPKQAAALIRPAWRTESFSQANEATILKEFSGLLTAADTKARMDKFFYDDDATEGLAVAKMLDGDTQKLAAARAAVVRKAPNAGQLLSSVPSRLKKDPGYIYSLTQYLRRSEKYPEAAKVMLSAPRSGEALVDPDAWWIERRVLSRELLDLGDARTAYKLVAEHAAESSSNQADAEFHAGWYALRFLNDPSTARRHFNAIRAVSTMPLSQSRADYWLGRSAEALGDKSEAIAQYRLAAAYPTTFYGQLAAAKLGMKQIVLSSPGNADGATRQRFNSREMVQAIQRFSKAGYDDRAQAFYMQLAETLTNPAEVGMLAQMAEQSGKHQIALQIGKKAYVRGLPVETLAFPTAAIPRTVKNTGIEKSVVYAIARQESAFNPAAVSHAGARGLLQLMPGTAKIVAKSAGVPYSLQRLTTDPGYNATLGAAHLADLVSDFNGSYIMSFAAYNAGKSRVVKWVQQYGDPRDPSVDAVDWIERIPFTETRNYVQRCTENLQVYRARLGEPALVINRDLGRGGPT
ncbi:lytic transglycosylase domain-containing protein [Kaistia dalseonensis]|uniref:Soluble lytic murein transglycosylase n=1 Tax=Kaistia dalseonensis TaxID=410840 RepID=A0ABU0H1E3_9HYPH|nr:lytic transglycosylase domain-containing protein [Kaistia dalseonensis]MCX5493565.1 lytic transglycosylase domain-containing protein [Kaistia dalseonensis]MDQ0436125.1 soluble lytic murein transglycosylase [Kaistia dalseonensis]